MPRSDMAGWQDRQHLAALSRQERDAILALGRENGLDGFSKTAELLAADFMEGWP